MVSPINTVFSAYQHLGKKRSSNEKEMSAITFVLSAFISVSSGLLEGIPPQEVLHSDATLQFLMSEVTRLSNELKEAQEKISTLDNQVGKKSSLVISFFFLSRNKHLLQLLLYLILLDYS